MSGVDDNFFDEDTNHGGDAAGGAARDGKLILLVLSPQGIRQYELRTDPLTVGRALGCDVHIDHPSVSRAHATILPGPSGPVLRDGGSTNGTYLDDAPVLGEVPLRAGHRVRFGQIAAQIQLLEATRDGTARMVSAEQFAQRLREEAARCIRHDRSMGYLTLEVAPAHVADLLRIGKTILQHTLRATDAITIAATGRLDILLGEAGKDVAEAAARRVHALFGMSKVPVELGVATFPGDAPSVESLALAAQLALRSHSQGGVGVAQGAVAVLQIGNRQAIVADPAMARLFANAERIASATLPALITGETGSGKEVLADALHHLGSRSPHPLIKLSCGALPHDLVEAELFGHERGAFTGATEARQGAIERAHRGTIFLDEVAELPLGVQAKLLRVVEDKRVCRLGAAEEHPVDVRVLAATSRDLPSEIAQGRFREDLYYRLNAILLAVPPLRERRREIRPLSERCIAEAARTARKPAPALGKATALALEAYAWPGNVRELQNALGRAVLVCEGEVLEPRHLPPQIAAQPSAEGGGPSRPEKTLEIVIRGSIKEQLAEVERARLVEALEKCDWNQTRTAEHLGMPRRTLVAKLGALGIERPGRSR